MQNSETILQGESDLEKGAYLGAIASIATADRQASPEEIEYIAALCDSASLSPEQKEVVIQYATETSGDDLTRCLDVLKTSNLKFSLLADLMAFAKADNDYSEAEQQSIKKIAQYLQIDQQQVSLLDHFADQATTSASTPEQVSSPDFLSSLGIKDKLQSAGINGNGLLKGLLGIAGPMILAKMVTGGLNRNRRSSGMFGGGSGMLGGGGFSRGGLGSIIGMLSGGRGMRSSGGLLSRILGGR